jgi:hypothetical protein
MQHNLQTASALGAMREGVREEQKGIDRIFLKRVINKSNENTLNVASKSNIGSSFGVADLNTGLLSVHPNTSETFRDIETVTTKLDIAERLTRSYTADPDKLSRGGKKFYSGQWFVINPTKNTPDTRPTWDRALITNKEDTLKTTLPDGSRVKGIKFGSEETGIKVLFRLDKR